VDHAATSTVRCYSSTDALRDQAVFRCVAAVEQYAETELGLMLIEFSLQYFRTDAAKRGLAISFKTLTASLYAE